MLRSISKLNGVQWRDGSFQVACGNGIIHYQSADNHPFELITLTNLGLGKCLSQLEHYCTLRNVSKPSYKEIISLLLKDLLSDSMTGSLTVALPFNSNIVIHYEMNDSYTFSIFECVIVSNSNLSLFNI